MYSKCIRSRFENFMCVNEWITFNPVRFSIIITINRNIQHKIYNI